MPCRGLPRTATEFAKERVDDGATVHTDGSRIYGELSQTRESVNHKAGEYVRGDVHTDSMESVRAPSGRGVHGTWRHVSKRRPRRHVKEASMRTDGGDFRNDTVDRMDALVRGMGGKRIGCRELMGSA